MKVLVMGATGGTGRAVVERLLADGHEVTAFSRRADSFAGVAPAPRVVLGDAMSAADVARAVCGQDAVVVTLGISENPIRVRLFGPARTPMDVRSAGTRHVVAAMVQHGVRRLVVQTTFGVGSTRDRLRFIDRMFFALLLRPQIDDTEIQNRIVQDSGLEWTIVQPVHLTGGDDAPSFVSAEGATGRMALSRRSVARFVAEEVVRRRHVHREVALSGLPAASRALSAGGSETASAESRA